MSAGLTKAEVNARFYNTVGGEILFATEGQGYLHPLAVARLVAAYANASGKRDLKILEIGANNCSFAMSLLMLLTQLRVHNEAMVSKVEYFAVEYARRSLEAALEEHADAGFDKVTPGARSPLVGSLARTGPPQIALYLVHAEANRFVTDAPGRFDFVIFNELLDDLPCRAFFCDADGARHELLARAEPDADKWVVTISATAADDASLVEMPPNTLTATSPESVELVRGAAALLGPGGMLLVHDYGFVERYTNIAKYEQMPKALPDFLSLELPDAGDQPFPRSFFRIFGSETANVVQITTDVNFAELTDVLSGSGRVIILPHGNAKLASRPSGEDDDYLRKGDGIFLSEFGALEVGDDLSALVSRLDEEQEALRESFASEFLADNASLYADLVFVKT